MLGDKLCKTAGKKLSDQLLAYFILCKYLLLFWNKQIKLCCIKVQVVLWPVLFLLSVHYLQPIFLGHALHDSQSSIIHHFAFINNLSSMEYPLLCAGTLFNRPALQRWSFVQFSLLTSVTHHAYANTVMLPLTSSQYSALYVLFMCDWYVKSYYINH